MTRPLLIRGGRIIDPSQCLDRIGNLLVRDGRIGWVGEGDLSASGIDTIKAEGLVVCPGFIDIHCHLRQPGYESKETIATGTRAAAWGGFTTVCAMPNTDPVLDSVSTIRYVKSLADKEGVIRVLPIACISRSQKGTRLVTMKALAAAGAVAFSDDGRPVMDSGLMRRALETAAQLGVPIIDHCEDISLTGSGHMNEGELSHRLGIGGIPSVGEEIMVARDISLAELTGAHVHIAHVSTAGSVELVRRAKDKGLKVTAEATPHHLTLTEEMVATRGSLAKVNPPLRTARDVAAVVRGVREGIIDAIATDHAPHTRRDKGANFARAAFGISGFETALGSLLALVPAGKISLVRLVAALTCAPARIMSIPELGTLQPGEVADITIIDPNREWIVAVRKFVSRGKNSPLDGAIFKGKVVATIYGGKLIYRDGITVDRTAKAAGEKRVGAA